MPCCATSPRGAWRSWWCRRTLEELLGLSDRIVVISDGRSVADLPSALLDEEKLTLLAAPRTSMTRNTAMLQDLTRENGGAAFWALIEDGQLICLNAVVAEPQADPGFRPGEARALEEHPHRPRPARPGAGLRSRTRRGALHPDGAPAHGTGPRSRLGRLQPAGPGEPRPRRPPSSSASIRWRRRCESLFDHWSGSALRRDVPNVRRGAKPILSDRRAARRSRRPSRLNAEPLQWSNRL